MPFLVSTWMKHGVFPALRLPDHPHQSGRIVSVHGAQIGDPHILEHHARDHQLLQAVLARRMPATTGSPYRVLRMA